VLTDNIFGDFLEDFLDFVSPAPVHLVMLNPTADVLRQREAGRGKSGYDDAVTVDALWRSVNEDTPRMGLWLDTSRQSAVETADAVLDRLDEALLG